MTHAIVTVLVLTGALIGSAPVARLQPATTPTDVVAAIVRADYTANLGDLAALATALPADQAGPRGARYRYWRGFASWRRAINGVNVNLDRTELERDLDRAIREFEAALSADPSFTDARVGLISCLQILGFLNRDDAARIKELVSRFVGLLKQALAEAPDHPRLLWVTGQSEWYAPPGSSPDAVRARQDRAIATYERGLRLVRAAPRPANALEPSWGEPELLMNLAWSQLNKQQPDPEAAEAYARQALALVPDWHYVREMLMPQIQRARVTGEKGDCPLLP